MGIPKRCVVPTTTSAPMCPGASNKTKLKISAATATLIPLLLAWDIKDFKSVIAPEAPGY